MKRGSARNRLLDRWLGIPLLRIATAFHRARPLPPPERVLRLGIFCSPALGDVLVASAAIQDIRDAYPASQLVLFFTAQNADAAHLLPGIDSFRQLVISRPLHSIAILRSERLDLLVDFSSWQRVTAFQSFWSGAACVAGFSSPRQHRHSGYDIVVDHRRDRHEIDNARALAVAVAAKNTHSPAIRDLSQDPTPPQQIADIGEIVVLHCWPSGQRSYLREWPADRWVELARRLQKPGRRFLLTGGPTDRPRTLALCAEMERADVDASPFSGSATPGPASSGEGLISVARLLQRSDLVVSVNTSIMHLAAIAGAPTLGLNGPTSNLRWGPVGAQALGVDSPGEGCGFLHQGFEFKSAPQDCMQRISVAQVLEAVEKIRPGFVPSSS